MSRQREDILHVIRSIDRHMTAEEIFLRCREENIPVSMATVYRNLGILTEQGLIRKVSLAGEPDRYDRELAEHAHLVCDHCKKIQDVHIDCLKRVLEEQTGTGLSSYDLCMHYICSDCRIPEQ